MNIGVIGTGYVGLVSGTCLSEVGHNVICMDIDDRKIDMLLKGIMPIYENDLEKLVLKNIDEERLQFTTSIEKTVKESDVIFIAVGTPPKDDGSADLQYVLEVAKNIGKNINNYKVIVNKSTVPVGTGKLVYDKIKKEIKKRGIDIEFSVVSNPEFLREGKAVYDFLNPDRIVVGVNDSRAKEVIKKVYNYFIKKNTQIMYTNIETSEMIKYASNAFLAVKISFINEMALLAEKVGANIEDIAKGMGQDSRISPKFLNAGAGYGGSCFPKDTKAIVDIAKQYNEEFYIIDSAIKANEKQKRKMVEKIVNNMNGVEGKTICILGLSFKPETDDVRDAPSIDIIKGLVQNGAKIHAFCPEGIRESKWRLEEIKSEITYFDNKYDAIKESNAVVVVTEWDEFKELDINRLKEIMTEDYFFDLRNIYSNNEVFRKEFKYFGVGVL
ncbi:MAG: UDP-glucose/GDP-mannose dehydrogenase family protein [Fusobacteria bacterium]|nr:UDP-glucose/GDP-mannose dehydrogenase family protein [Fusobacteriota bacterium]